MEELSLTFRTERLMLARSVTWKTDNEKIWFFSDGALLLEGLGSTFVRCLEKLDRGVEYHELAALVSDRAQLDEVLEILIALRYVIRAGSNSYAGTRMEKQIDYFASQGLEPNVAQVRIEDAHIIIVGLGGIGSVVLQHLVAAGVGNYTLIDFDTVQSSNLNRQFVYRPSDTGQSKVARARDYIYSLEPEALVTTHTATISRVTDLECLNIAKPAALLLLAADLPPGTIQTAAATFCHQQQITFLGGGCGVNTAAWGPLITPAYSSRYLEYLSQQSESSTSQDLPPVPEKITSASFGPTNTIVAAFMARDILHYLAGLEPASLNRSVIINYESLTINRSRAWFNSHT